MTSAPPRIPDQAELMEATPAAVRKRPRRRIVAWALIVGGIAAFVVAGDVRTNWVVGDIRPARGEEALPRLGTVALMIGMALLARHQVRERRALPEARYRGSSVLRTAGADARCSLTS